MNKSDLLKATKKRIEEKNSFEFVWGKYNNKRIKPSYYSPRLSKLPTGCTLKKIFSHGYHHQLNKFTKRIIQVFLFSLIILSFSCFVFKIHKVFVCNNI